MGQIDHKPQVRAEVWLSNCTQEGTYGEAREDSGLCIDGLCLSIKYNEAFTTQGTHYQSRLRPVDRLLVVDRSRSRLLK